METKTGATSLRLYFALWPDENTRAALLHLQREMRGRLVPYVNFHLTMAFLGKQPSELLPALKELLAELPSSDITLELDRIGYFTASRIAWAGPHTVPDTLIALRKELADALARHGVAFDDRSRFKPHITLARDADMPSDMVFTPITWHADQLVLVQSTTHATGSRYEVLARRSLQEQTRTMDERGPTASSVSAG